MRHKSIFFTVIFVIVACFCLVGCQDDTAPKVTEFEIEYKDGITLSSITPPEGYAWTFPDYELEVGVNLCTLTIGNKRYQVRVNVLPGKFENIVFEDTTCVYDGEPKSILISGDLPEGTTVEYLGNDVTEVGEYVVTAAISRDGYESLMLTAKITITKAAYDMSSVSFTDKTYVYDGTEKTLTIDGQLPEGVSVEYTPNAITDVGSITVTASFIGDANYEDIEPMTATLTVVEAIAPEITFADASFVYDGSPKSIFITGDLPTGISVTYTGNGATDAGTYTVTATFSSDGNYTAPVEMTATLVIEKADFGGELTLPGYKGVYDGQKHSLSVNGAPNGSEIIYTGNEAIDAGSYEVIALVTHRNYNSKELRSFITIDRAKYDVGSLSFSSRQFVYDGTPKFIYAEGLPEGVTVNYIGNGMVDSGVYTVVADFISDSNHEDISSKTAELTINRAPLKNITFNDGRFIYDGKKKEIFVGGDIPADTRISYSGNGMAAAGIHAVTARIAVTDNYEPVSDMKARLIIEPAEVTGVTLPDLECIYDGNPHSVEIEGSLPNGAVVTYVGNGAIDAGAHKVTAKIELSSNYKPIPDITATIVIRKATVGKITLPSKEYVYDGMPHSLSIEGDLPSDAEVTYLNNSHTDAGIYEVTARVKVSDNYNAIDDLTSVLTIKQAVWGDVSFPSGKFVYDGSPHSIFVEGELPPSSSVTYVNNGQTDAGVYTVTAKVLLSSNYVPIDDLKATLTIEQAIIEGITFSGGTYSYDGTVKSPLLIGVPTEIVTARIEGKTAIDVGTYRYKATFTVDKNYQDIADMHAEISILRADPSYICEKTEFTYDGRVKSLNIVEVCGEGAEIKVDAINAGSGLLSEIRDIGEYEVTLSVSETANYNSGKFNFTVNVVSNAFAYDFVDGSCRIHDYTGSSTILIYPNSVYGKAVCSIEQQTVNDMITSIDIGGSAKEVKLDKFIALGKLLATDNPHIAAVDNTLYDSNLTRILAFATNHEGVVNIPNSIKHIGTVFKGTRITAVYAHSVTLSPNAFADCEKITIASFTVSDGVIPEGAFWNCVNLSFDMDGIRKIGENAFCNVKFEKLLLDISCTFELNSFSPEIVGAVSCAYGLYTDYFANHNVKYITPYSLTSGYTVTLNYGDPYFDMESGDIFEHTGADLTYDSAVALQAFCNGTIAAIDGSSVTILSDDGVQFTYGDITPSALSEGQKVIKGETIAYADNIHVLQCVQASYTEGSYIVHLSVEYRGTLISPDLIFGLDATVL